MFLNVDIFNILLIVFSIISFILSLCICVIAFLNLKLINKTLKKIEEKEFPDWKYKPWKE